jgi:hypothetical protein
LLLFNAVGERGFKLPALGFFEKYLPFAIVLAPCFVRFLLSLDRAPPLPISWLAPNFGETISLNLYQAEAKTGSSNRRRLLGEE